jgi:hypothetical protein
MKNIRFFLFILSLTSGMGLFAQQVVIKADTVVGVAGDSVTIPITYTNLSNIGSVTLYIEFNATLLKWGRALNWEPGFNNGFNLANVSGNTLVVTCINVNGFTAAQGKLADLRFKYMGPSAASLTFTGSSEITDLNGLLISPAPQYKNGLVVSALNVTASATPVLLCQGTTTQVSAQASGLFGNYNYQWATSPAGFTSAQASFNHVPAVTTRYHVTVSSGPYSDTASVLVTVMSVIIPDPVSSMFPVNGATGLSNHVTLSWAPAANATSYDIYYWPASASQPATPSVSNITAISYNIPANLSQGTTYKWRVVSKTPCSQAEGPVYQFTMIAFPELHVTQVTVSAAYSGLPIDISWTVKNDGQGATTTPIWYDRVWISPDIEIRVGETDQDKLLGTFTNVSYLGPGESYTQTQTVTLPPNLIGTYYIFVITDALDACLISWPSGGPQLPYSPPPYVMAYTHGGSGVDLVKEVSDAPPYHDNFFYKEINLATPPLPDLKVINILKSSSIFSGQTLTVTWTVLNDGDATGTATYWSDRIYLTADTILNTSTAFDLGTFNHNGQLAPDSIYIQSAQVNVPNYINGNFFVYVYTDIFNNAFEHVYEGNNITRSDTLKVFLTPPPDLVVTTINIPDSASNNESVVIKFIVNNQGATATTAPVWYDRVYLSQSATGDLTNAIILANTGHYGEVISFGSYSAQSNCIIPKSISGSWYVYVKADIDNAVFEHTSENNNLLRSEGMIQILNPDLHPLSILSPAIDSTNAPLIISWYDKNSGPGDLLNQIWSDKLYVSLNAVFDPGSAILFDSISNNIAIKSNDSLFRSKQTILPNVNTGLYYTYIACDNKNQIFESIGEGNNIGHSIGTIWIKKPDLIVQSLNSASSGESGLPLTVNVSLKNNGAGVILNKNITDKLYLSPTAAFNVNDAILLSTKPHLCHLSSNETSSLTLNPAIPDGLTGNYYLVYVTDFNDDVKEGTYENNNTYVSPSPIAITNGPWADLIPQSLNIPASVVAGLPISINYTVSNTGTKNTANIAWKDKIYKSTSIVWDSTNATLEKTIDKIEPLAMGSSYSNNANLTIPANHPAGTYYYFVFTDATNKVFEYTDEDNNVFGPAILQVEAYPSDIKLDSASVNISSIETGQNFQYTYQVKNTGTVNTLVTQWYDALYLSTDSIWNKSTDILVSKWVHYGALTPGSDYTLTKPLSIPNGLSGTYYLIGVTDLDNNNADIYYPDNAWVLKSQSGQNITIGITLAPPPDLAIASFTAPPQVIAGQSFPVYFTIKNQGTGPTKNNWKEKLFLSGDFDINTGDITLGSFNYNGILDPGETYSDSMLVTVTQNMNANMILILKTDADNSVYEHTNESNNTVTSFLVVALAPPVDLVVENITGPLNAVVGDMCNVSWVIKNLGANTATGQLKDAIYLSTDTIFDSSDKLWITYQAPVNILPLGTISRSLNSLLSGLTLGDYYLIARTDLLNSFVETVENNNRKVSGGVMSIDYQSLQLEVLKTDTLTDLESIYYKLVIPDSLAGETFSLILKGDSINGTNEVFASLNKVPTRISYQYKYRFPFEGNQELLIPALSAGTYYFYITGSTFPANEQHITLLPAILNFEISEIDMNKGGNKGNITVRITGSKFTPGTKFFLVNDSIEIEGFDLIFIDPSRVMVSFNLYTIGTGLDDYALKGIPAGYYDVAGRKDDGTVAMLPGGFEVTTEQPPVLLTNLEYPASVRPDRFFTMSIQFVNTGNVNIPVPKRTLLSKQGAPIGFSTEELVFNYHDLYLEFSEPGGSLKFLRPGAVSEIKIHCKSTHPLVFKLVK